MDQAKAAFQRVLSELAFVIPQAQPNSLTSLYLRWAENLPTPLKLNVLRHINQRANELLVELHRLSGIDSIPTDEVLRRLYNLTSKTYDLLEDWNLLQKEYASLRSREIANDYNAYLVPNYNRYVSALRGLDDTLPTKWWKDTIMLKEIKKQPVDTKWEDFF